MIHDETPDFPSLEDRLFQAITINDLCRTFDLIKTGADLSATDWFGWTVLQCAESYEMIKLLIQHGADPDLADERGGTVWKTTSPEVQAFIQRAQATVAFDALAAGTHQVTGAASRRL
jgi:hypothetical protein